MPTNFQISYQPTLRYVTAVPCALTQDASTDYFRRWRHTERLVIHGERGDALSQLVAGGRTASLLSELKGVFPR